MNSESEQVDATYRLLFSIPSESEQVMEGNSWIILMLFG